MANPYEGTDQSLIGEIQNLDIDPTQAVETVTNTINSLTDSQEIAAMPSSTSTEQEETYPIKTDTYAKRKQRNEEFYAWRKLPDGEEKTQASNQWAMKYHGKSYAEYKSEKDAGKPKNAWQAYQGYSALGNQEVMMSPAVGMLDWFTDLANWGTKSIRQPFKAPEIPKVPEFENEGATALREISSLVGPFFLLKGKAIGGGTAIHKSKIAAKYAPLLYKLGNNTAFQRFAKVGLDQGVGAFVDAIGKQNSMNDTLATSWKRGKWWGHQLIPESWTSDKLSPDMKHRANVLEGQRLGFFSNVIEGFFKLNKALGNTRGVTTYLDEAGKKSSKLNDTLLDPLDAKVFDETDAVADEVLRGEAKRVREIDSLTEFYKSTNKLDDVTEPTVGIHKFTDAANESVLPKSFDGIIGAAKDQAQIANNLNTTFGRLGNTITEGFRKAGLEVDNITNRTIINSLRDELVNGGKYSVKLPDGSFLSAKQIENEGIILAEIISDPTLPKGDLVKILNNFKSTIDGVEKLNKVGYDAVSKANKTILQNWADINTDKATAYFITSEAGQISDIAEGARLGKDSNAISRANDLILDRVELFEIETKVADFNFKARKNLISQLNADPTNATKYLNQIDSLYTAKLQDIIPRAKRFTNILRDIQTNAPEFAEVIRYSYEMADGHVQSIKDLNKYIENSFGFWGKSIYDPNFKIPSFMYKGLMGQLFHNMLSAIGTPIRALYGNFGGFVSEPISALYGGLRQGDLKDLRRSSYMYFGFTDTLQNGFQYMGKTFRKAAVDPQSLKKFTRKDFNFSEGLDMTLNKKIADASAKKGFYGPQALLGWHDEMEMISNSPWFGRYSPLAMTGFDGFTQATQKIALDKAKAFDLLEAKYPNGKWSNKEFDELWKDLYTKNRDADGFIKDEAVDWARSEVALNLETDVTKTLDPWLAKWPIARSVFWFPKTITNYMDMFGKYGPRAGIKGVTPTLGPAFASEYVDYYGKFGTRKLDSFSLEEMIAANKKVKNFDPKDSAEVIKAKFVHRRSIVGGRVALGNIAVMGGGMLALQDRIRGYGSYDPKVQKVNAAQGYERMTYKGLDGKWHSYEHLGPLGTWLALTVTAFENYDMVSTSAFEDGLKKFGFIFGAAVTDQSLLGAIEPVFDIISGRGAPVNRYTTQMTNVLFPLASFRNELGKNLFGMLREVQYDDFGEMMRNKNNWLDVFDPLGKQPDLINFVTGRPINRQGENILQRSAKTIFGFGGTADGSPEGNFLMEMEYDITPQFNTAPNGVMYNSQQKSELKALMGKDGHFNRELKKIMNDYAPSVTYVTPSGKVITGYFKVMRHLRRTGNTSKAVEEYSRIKNKVDRALDDAIGRVHSRLSTADEIDLEGKLDRRAEEAALNQNSKALNETLGLTRN